MNCGYPHGDCELGEQFHADMEKLRARVAELEKERDAAIKERDEARAELSRELDSTGTHLRTCDFVTCAGRSTGCDCTCGGVAKASRSVKSTPLRDAITDAPNPEK